VKLGEREREAVREILAGLAGDVDVEVVLGPEDSPVAVLAGGAEIDFGAETRSLLEEIAALSDRVRLSVQEVEERGQWPQTTIGGRLVYRGLPWGYELTSVIHGILEAGAAEPALSPSSLAVLGALDRDVTLEVFVTPT
jgi:alkyl hydroperoxide reductase subunit F